MAPLQQHDVGTISPSRKGSSGSSAGGGAQQMPGSVVAKSKPSIFPTYGVNHNGAARTVLKEDPSKFDSSSSSDSGSKEEHTVPWIAALTTYFGYAVLILFGHLRDSLQTLLCAVIPSRYVSDCPEGYAPLMSDFQHFYTRRLYCRIQDCFNRPICSAPGAWIDVIERTKADDHNTMQLCTGERGELSYVTALNLSSYNYLGFAETDLDMRDEVVSTMRRFGVSSTCSRTEVGCTEVVRQLEERIATFVGKPAAIVFGMGFATNSTVIPALVGKGALIISDELNHSSIVTGARSSGSKIKVFKHNDASSLENILRNSIVEGQPRTHRPWRKIIVIVEGIYSMEGEICNLKEIVAVCKRYKAYIYVDEAHSIGALGVTGRGVLEHTGVSPKDVDIMMGTFTKSFGSSGGYIASSAEIVEHLRRTSPGSIYACSMAPGCAVQANLALRMIMGEDGTKKGQEKVEQLRKNSNLFRAGLERMGCEVLGDRDSPIVPVMLYNPAKMPAFSRQCLERKLAVVVVGFPATPVIKSRVRFCISAAHTEHDLISALRAISEVADQVMIKYKWNGRPNVLPSSDLVRQSQHPQLVNVVGKWEAHHFAWKDTLTIAENGRFARGNGDEGCWNVHEHNGKTILRLEWDRWPTEELELHQNGDDKECASPRRHIFRGNGNIIISAGTPCPGTLHTIFTLRPLPPQAVDVDW